MRNKLFISCMLLVATLASCTKNELSDLSKSDDLQTVTITVAPEEVVVTRATEGITNYVIEVYTDNTYATPANIFNEGTTNQASNATGTFSMVLDKSKNYYCLFWADNGTSYSTTTLKEVTVAESQSMTEAYQGTEVITGLQASYAVTLKRAVAKITLTESQRLPQGSLTMSLNEFPSFNVSTGVAEGTQAPRNETFSILADITGVTKLTEEFYYFARVGNDIAEKDLHTITFTYTVEGGQAETPFDLTNVPLRANYITNIKGHFTSMATYSFTMSCDDVWDAEENNVDVPNESTPPGPPAGLPSDGILDWAYSENIKSGRFNGPTYTLTGSTTDSYNSFAIISGNNGANPDNGGFKTDEAACIAELPHHKLEIAPANEKKIGTESYEMTWADAYAACKAKAPAGEWRLPRMSELMWMWLNKAALEVEGFTPFGAPYYWSATERYDAGSWSVYFNIGITANTSKTNTSMRSRCVREL